MNLILWPLLSVPLLAVSAVARLTMKIGQAADCGHITEGRYWLCVERHRFQRSRWLLHFGPTYNGTTHGAIICTPWICILAHRRNLSGSK